MNYRSFQDLSDIIYSKLYQIDPRTDLVVGIPRSGLLAANLVALYMNLPLADLESFIDGKILKSGNRLSNIKRAFSDYQNILVIDDSVYTGGSIAYAQHLLHNTYPEKNIVYATIFVTPEAKDKVDLFFDICPVPRVFQWNIMHHDFLEKCCVDIDGVLCCDPTSEENDDGDNYLNFLKNVKILIRPTARIGYLVTNRLEKYRKLTEDWLKRNKIHYNHLIMMDLPSKSKRQELNCYADHKAIMYLKYNCTLFIESSEWQSKRIVELTGKPVFCFEKQMMLTPKG